MEREITSTVEIAQPDGRLNRDAIGWSRTPLHRCNLKGSFPRKKRWDYWCFVNDETFFAITLANVDYFGLAVVTFLDLETHTLVEKVGVVPLGLGVHLPDAPQGGGIAIDAMGLHVRVRERANATHLEVDSRVLRASVVVDRAPKHESLNVLVPFSDRRFQFTSKQFALPAHGDLEVKGRERDFRGFGCLDFGRGIWPYRTEWNWGCAAGVQGERTIGFNLGGRWTDGTGTTENGMLVDGRLHKIGDEMAFRYDRHDLRRPWTLVSPRVDLRFAPIYERHARLELGLLGAELHWCLGRYSGTIIDDVGTRVAIDSMLGWAEEVRARW